MTQLNQFKAKGNSFGIIKVKQSNGGTPTCGNAFDQSAIETKMAIPSLFTRIEEEGDFLRGGVNRSQV